MALIILIIIAIIAAAIGSSKGYSGVGCFFAGLIGSLITVIVLLFLPNKIEQEKAAEEERYRAKVMEQKTSTLLQQQSREIENLRSRIRELEEEKNNSAAAPEENA